ncbi:hypothetical protein ABK040_007250 [Willaertia magna]
MTSEYRLRRGSDENEMDLIEPSDNAILSREEMMRRSKKLQLLTLLCDNSSKFDKSYQYEKQTKALDSILISIETEKNEAEWLELGLYPCIFQCLCSRDRIDNEFINLIQKVLLQTKLSETQNFIQFCDAFSDFVYEEQNITNLLYLLYKILMQKDETYMQLFINRSGANFLLDLYRKRLVVSEVDPMPYGHARRPMIKQGVTQHLLKSPRITTPKKPSLKTISYNSQITEQESKIKRKTVNDFGNIYVSPTMGETQIPTINTSSVHNNSFTKESGHLSARFTTSRSVSTPNVTFLDDSSISGNLSNRSLSPSSGSKFVPPLKLPNKNSQAGIGFTRSSRRIYHELNHLNLESLRLSIDTLRQSSSDESVNNTTTKTKTVEEKKKTSIEYFNSLAAKLGELYIANDLTYLIPIKRDLDMQLSSVHDKEEQQQQQLASNILHKTESPNVIVVKKENEEEKTSTVTTKNNELITIEEMILSNDASIHRFFVLKLLQAITKFPVIRKFARNPVNMLMYELNNLSYKTNMVGNESKLIDNVEYQNISMIFDMLSQYAADVEAKYFRLWRMNTSGKSYDPTRDRALKKFDIFLWRWAGIAEQVTDTEDWEEIEYQLQTLSKYLYSCVSRVQASQCTAVCLETLLKLQVACRRKSRDKHRHYNFRMVTEGKDSTILNIIHLLLEIFDFIIGSPERHPLLLEFFYFNLIENSETFSWLREYAIFTLKEDYACSHKTKAFEISVEDRRVRVMKHYQVLMDLFQDLGEEFFSKKEENSHHIKQKNLLNYMMMNETSGISNASNNSSGEEQFLNEDSGVMKQFDFLVNPIDGLVLGFLTKGPITENYIVKKEMLTLLEKMFRLPYLPFLRIESYVNTYIRYHYLNFVKLYIDEAIDDITLEACTLHMNVLIAFSMNKTPQIANRFYTLRVVRFLAREIDLEYKIHEKRQQNSQNKLDQMSTNLNINRSTSTSEISQNQTSSTDNVSTHDEQTDTENSDSDDMSDFDSPKPTTTALPTLPSLSFGAFGGGNKPTIPSIGAAVNNNNTNQQNDNDNNKNDNGVGGLKMKLSIPKLGGGGSDNNNSATSQTSTSNTLTTKEEKKTTSDESDSYDDSETESEEEEVKPKTNPLMNMKLPLNLATKTNESNNSSQPKLTIPPISLGKNNQTSTVSNNNETTKLSFNKGQNSARDQKKNKFIVSSGGELIIDSARNSARNKLQQKKETNNATTNDSEDDSEEDDFIDTPSVPKANSAIPKLNFTLGGSNFMNPTTTTAVTTTKPTLPTIPTTVIKSPKIKGSSEGSEIPPPPTTKTRILDKLKLETGSRKSGDFSLNSIRSTAATSESEFLYEDDLSDDEALSSLIETTVQFIDRYDAFKKLMESDEVQFYEQERKNRKLYRSDKLHVAIITLLMSLMITSNSTLDSKYTDQYPLNKNLPNIPFMLHYHINDLYNEKIIPLLHDTISTHCSMNDELIGLAILLRLLSKKLFEPNLYSVREERLGFGAYGDVWRCKLKFTHSSVKTVAVKLLKVPKMIDETCILYNIFNEILIMEKFKADPRICRMYDYGVSDDYYYIVMKEYKCSLKSWRAKQTQPFLQSIPLYMNIFKRILESYKFLYDNNINHFDLKCDNIFLEPFDGVKDEEFFHHESDMPHFELVIGDFGESFIYSNDEDDGYTTRHRGTECIKSPEMLKIEMMDTKSKNYDRRRKVGANSASDIWSLGCLFYELLSAEFLFDATDFTTFFMLLTDNKKTLISQERFLRIHYNHFLMDILSYILVRDPLRRPSINDLTQRFSYFVSVMPSMSKLKDLKPEEIEEEFKSARNSLSSRGVTPKIITHNIDEDYLNHPLETPHTNRKASTIFDINNNDSKNSSNSKSSSDGGSFTSNNTNEKSSKSKNQVNEEHNYLTPYNWMKEDVEFYINKATFIMKNRLYLVSDDLASDKSILNRLGITHVVNCCISPSKSQFSENFFYFNLKEHISESSLKAYSEYIRAFEFVRDAIRKRGRVLVYSGKGLSRSGLFVILFLMDTYNLSSYEAYLFVKSRRPALRPEILTHFLHFLLKVKQLQWVEKQKKRTLSELRTLTAENGSILETLRSSKSPIQTLLQPPPQHNHKKLYKIHKTVSKLIQLKANSSTNNTNNNSNGNSPTSTTTSGITPTITPLRSGSTSKLRSESFSGIRKKNEDKDMVHWYRCLCGACVVGVVSPHISFYSIHSGNMTHETSPMRCWPSFLQEMKLLYFYNSNIINMGFSTKDKVLLEPFGVEQLSEPVTVDSQSEFSDSIWKVSKCKYCGYMIYATKDKEKEKTLLYMNNRDSARDDNNIKQHLLRDTLMKHGSNSSIDFNSSFTSNNGSGTPLSNNNNSIDKGIPISGFDIAVNCSLRTTNVIAKSYVNKVQDLRPSLFFKGANI